MISNNMLIDGGATAYTENGYPAQKFRWMEDVGSIIGEAGRGLIVTDNSGRICLTNSRLSEMVGYTADELLGENPRMFQSGNTTGSTYIRMWNTLSSGRTWRGVLQNRRKNGNTFVEDITISPVTDERGSIAYFFGIVEELDAGLARNPAYYTPEQLEKVRWISNGIAHEVRNVLAGIIGHCSLLGKTTTSLVKDSHRIESINTLAYRLSAFSDRLSLCAGYPLLKQKRLTLNKVVLDALNVLSQRVDLSQVRYDLVNESIYVSGSPELLETAVIELIANALEAFSAKERNIIVSVQQIDWNGPTVSEGLFCADFELPIGPVACIQISDDASGMEQALLDRATELFFSSKRTHAGLGLPSVLGISKSHAGAFELESDLGQGTSARLLLPPAALNF